MSFIQVIERFSVKRLKFNYSAQLIHMKVFLILDNEIL